MTQKELEEHLTKKLDELATKTEEEEQKKKDEQKQKLREEVIELTENTLDFPISDCMDYSEFIDSNFDRVYEKLQERILEEEIIYYSKAIKYLYEEDPSLRESLELADNYGYNINDLNSEKLATLLLQQRLEDYLIDIKDDLEELQEKAQELEEL